MRPGDGQDGTEGPSDASEAEDGADGPDTFSRAYVEKLRAENAENRTKAKRADELAARLLAVTVEQATAGILADPTDLPVSSDLYDEDGYPDVDRIEEAARELVARKPHLADRRPTGPLEQGPRDQAKGVNLASILRTLAS